MYYPIWPRSEFLNSPSWAKLSLETTLLENQFSNVKYSSPNEIGKPLGGVQSLIQSSIDGQDIKIRLHDDDDINSCYDPDAIILKFHVWSVNNWFSRYASSDLSYRQLYT